MYTQASILKKDTQLIFLFNFIFMFPNNFLMSRAVLSLFSRLNGEKNVERD